MSTIEHQLVKQMGLAPKTNYSPLSKYYSRSLLEANRFSNLKYCSPSPMKTKAISNLYQDNNLFRPKVYYFPSNYFLADTEHLTFSMSKDLIE